jgi:hypothetical protein
MPKLWIIVKCIGEASRGLYIDGIYDETCEVITNEVDASLFFMMKNLFDYL